uniref:Uncharacterized protein n=1 Tax=Rhizophora mucronata TaxID=61149 RepID=A0A2P2KET6_RHIMU
MTLFCFTL